MRSSIVAPVDAAQVKERENCPAHPTHFHDHARMWVKELAQNRMPATKSNKETCKNKRKRGTILRKKGKTLEEFRLTFVVTTVEDSEHSFQFSVFTQYIDMKRVRISK